MDLSQEILPKLERTPATEPAQSDNFAKVQAQIHVFACSKFNKKGNFVFSSLSTITGDPLIVGKVALILILLILLIKCEI